MKSDINFGANFECKNLTFVRSFFKGTWLRSIYTPPVTAQFLQNISFRVSHGEIHGIMGANGSGKSTLLNVLSHRLEGRLSGDVLLNGQPLNKKRFNDLCEFVDMNVSLMPYLTVEELLTYHARLSLNCKHEAIWHRSHSLMQQFDLVAMKREKVGSLHESALRRLMLVLHLVKDPVLIVIDEPIHNLDALSAYQFITSLQAHVKKHARMAIVSMRCPRSDIYQLMNQITLMFYGEIMYSGPTKQMPHYFSQLGYRCMCNENPAVYYLSLATVDRETPESYAESRTKAMKLVEHFRKNHENAELMGSHIQPTNESPILSCYFGTPPNTKRVKTRNFLLLFKSPTFFLSHLLLPFVIILVAIFGIQFSSTGSHIPHSAAGMIFLLIFLTAIISIVETIAEMSSTMFWEVAQELYNASYMLIAYLFISTTLNLFSILISSTAFIWLTTLELQLEILCKLALVLICTQTFYKLLTLSIFVFVADPFNVVISGTLLCCISSTVSSTFIKSYSTYSSFNQILYYPTYLSIERYANILLLTELVNKTKVVNCIQDENTFCMWNNGSQYLYHDILPPFVMIPEIWIGPCLVAALIPIVIFSYVLVGQKYAQSRILRKDYKG